MTAMNLQRRFAMLLSATDTTDSITLKTAMIDAALDAMVAMDEAGRIIEFNPAAEQLFGYSRQEAIGRSVGDLIVPERYRAAHEAGMKRLQETGKASVLNRLVRIEALCADGRLIPVELKISNAMLGERMVFTAVIRGIDERVDLERERLRTLDLTQAAIESISDGFVIFGPDGHLALCNSAYAALFRETTDSLQGTSLDTNLRRALSIVRRPETAPDGTARGPMELLLQRLRDAEREPVEVQLKDGR